MQKLYQADPLDARVGAYGQLLHDEAVLAEGSKLADPSAFARRINELIAKDAAKG
jgi:molecular chaperone HtpG